MQLKLELELDGHMYWWRSKDSKLLVPHAVRMAVESTVHPTLRLAHRRPRSRQINETVMVHGPARPSDTHVDGQQHASSRDGGDHSASTPCSCSQTQNKHTAVHHLTCQAVLDTRGREAAATQSSSFGFSATWSSAAQTARHVQHSYAGEGRATQTLLKLNAMGPAVMQHPEAQVKRNTSKCSGTHKHWCGRLRKGGPGVHRTCADACMIRRLVHITQKGMPQIAGPCKLRS